MFYPRSRPLCRGRKNPFRSLRSGGSTSNSARPYDSAIKYVLLFIFCGATGAFGIWQIILGIQSVGEARDSAIWPTTTALIDSSSVVRNVTTARHSRSTSYRPTISYTYSVNDKTFTNTDITPGRIWGSASANAVVDEFPAGSHPAIHYSPDDPQKALLISGLHRYNYGGLGSGLFFFSLAILFSLIFVRATGSAAGRLLLWFGGFVLLEFLTLLYFTQT